MTQDLAFKAAPPPAEGIGLRVKDRRLQDWLSPSAAGYASATAHFIEPLVFQPIFPRSLGAAPVGQLRQPDEKPVQMISKTIADPEGNNVAARLFNVRANAKMVAAQVSMHLKPEWRAKIYRQIDRLLDVEQWDEGDGLLDVASMKSFLRFIIYANATAVPSLGMAPTGAILAAWRADTRRLTIEFRGNDSCRLAISHFTGDDTSIITFSGSTVQARSFLDCVDFPLG
jgi:hypothetical protein